MSSDSDSSGPNDKAPPKKKTKEEKPAKKSEKPEKKSEKPEKKSKKRAKSDDEDDEEGEDGRWEIHIEQKHKIASTLTVPLESEFFAIAPKRFVSVSEFKGRKRVDIREFYTTPDGEEKPGRKGISMPEDQWKKLKAIIPKIDKHMNDI